MIMSVSQLGPPGPVAALAFHPGYGGVGAGELDGMVTVPGADQDVSIEDIPVVTELEHNSETSANAMYYRKPISPAGVQDFYTTGYLTSSCSSPETGSVSDGSSSLCPQSIRDYDHMYASLNRVDTGALVAQNSQLRSMMVANMDLIQQQAEALVSKDREIKELREERDLLVQKLARMKRRVRQEGDTGQGEKRQVEGERVGTVKKRRSEVVRQQQAVAEVDQLTDEFAGESEEGVDREPGDRERVRVRGAPRREKNRVSGASRSPGVPKGGRKSRVSLGGLGSTLPAQNGLPCLPPLLSEEPYYVGCCNFAASREERLTEVPQLQRGVEVPSFREDESHYKLYVQRKQTNKETPTWRIKSTNPAYTDTEGTENTDDTTYLKRHEKLEKEEKQRKRWDLQRIREQQQLQRLRARQEKQHAATVTKKPKDEFLSLLPSLEKATHILVDEKIPVSCFGKLLPVLSQTDFTLPFLDN